LFNACPHGLELVGIGIAIVTVGVDNLDSLLAAGNKG
jgi:hypothetical protein